MAGKRQYKFFSTRGCSSTRGKASWIARAERAGFDEEIARAAWNQSNCGKLSPKRALKRYYDAPYR